MVRFEFKSLDQAYFYSVNCNVNFEWLKIILFLKFFLSLIMEGLIEWVTKEWKQISLAD